MKLQRKPVTNWNSRLISVVVLGLVSFVLVEAFPPFGNVVGQEDFSGHWTVKKVVPKRLDDIPEFPSGGERVIEDRIPTHLPIKVILSNLDKEPLLHSLEIRVTNLSEKPIYFLELDLLVPAPQVPAPGGIGILFPLRYGRMDFVNFLELPKSDDKPILPGESLVFEVPETNVKGFEGYIAANHIALSEIRLIYLFFQQINFGDKTGFTDTNGSPIPGPKTH